MSNDPRDIGGERLQAALHTLGRYPDARARLMRVLRELEQSLPHAGSVRDEITGPIVDALHDENDTYEKTLADGTRFRFLFRTKIARDFLMAEAAAPSHVWEPQTTKLMLDLCGRSNGDVLVGGAYFGDQAILVAARAAHRGAVVHCFEPGREQADMLVHNARINELTNIVVNRLALWSQSDVRLKLEGFDSFANVVEASAGDAAFATVTIDDYRLGGGFDVGLVQLDIEGAELRALQGAQRTLAECRPFVVFEIHRHYVDWSGGLARTEICRLLNALGYSLFAVRDFNTHHEMGNKPVELIPADRVYLDGPAHGFNMLAVPGGVQLDGPGYRYVADVSPKLLSHKSPALHHPLDGL